MRYSRLFPGTVVEVTYPNHPCEGMIALVAAASKDAETLWVSGKDWKDNHLGGWAISREHVEIIEGDDTRIEAIHIPPGSIVKVSAFDEHPFEGFEGIVQGSSPCNRIHYIYGKLWPPNIKGGWPILDCHTEVIKFSGQNNDN